MSSEPAQMSRDQLVDEVEDLRRHNQALEARVDALNTQFNEFKRLLLGERELSEDGIQAREGMVATLDRHEERLNDAHEMAQDAQVAVTEIDERVETGGSNQDRIRAVIRDRLVKRALKGQHDGEYVGIRLADFDDNTPPDLDVAYQQAKRVTEDLVERWPAFVGDKNGDGEKVVRAIIPAIDQDLANRCERSLGRDDLANIVVRREKGGGR